MRLYIILFFSAMLMFAACSDSNDVPKDVIPRHEMVNLLMDVHIVDGSMNVIVQIPDTMYKYGTVSYLNLFKRYHTDSVQFRRSLKFYTTRPEMLQAMYDEVQKKIGARSDSIAKIQIQTPAKSPASGTNNQNPQHPHMPGSSTQAPVK